jgi:hypothetical protein
MSEVEVKVPHKTTISLVEAVHETENWRMVLFPFMQEKVLRGFYIPMKDIIDLAKMHEDAIAVRGYFILNDPKRFTDVRIALVPVGEDGKDILFRKNLAGEEQSTIYDFTQPCPHLCDEGSPLY